ncbi:MAG: hypothetical protein A2138_09995 [Deltaproteobacteria bacterium RBG_16_71_12]|nr:MAG: hypothetical protein A2138_09995 [Deltaproteobacteria bacterium RBG_16_71_12]
MRGGGGGEACAGSTGGALCAELGFGATTSNAESTRSPQSADASKPTMPFLGSSGAGAGGEVAANDGGRLVAPAVGTAAIAASGTMIDAMANASRSTRSVRGACCDGGGGARSTMASS